MNKNYLLLILLALTIFSCSTGKKALQKGDYFNAITQAVERLKSDPDNKNATQVLRDGYPMAMDWSQEEMDFALSSNAGFKWEKAIHLMQQVNRLSDLIRSTPAARNIITNPKSYSSELNMAYEKAAEQRYTVGLSELEKNTQKDARTAFEHFYKADQLIPGYNNVQEKMEIAKNLATVQVIVEAVTVNTRNYKLSSEFFYDQIFEYLNNRFPQQGFVNFVSPGQADNLQITQPDFIVRMEFFDFSVGNIVRNQKKESLVKREEVAINDSTKVTKTYRAELKTYTDEVISEGRLNYKIIDFQSDKLMRDKLIPGSFTWINQYAIYAGDAKALNTKQEALISNDALPLPPKQELFIEFTRPIYTELTSELYGFFRRYK